MHAIMPTCNDLLSISAAWRVARLGRRHRSAARVMLRGRARGQRQPDGRADPRRPSPTLVGRADGSSLDDPLRRHRPQRAPRGGRRADQHRCADARQPLGRPVGADASSRFRATRSTCRSPTGRRIPARSTACTPTRGWKRWSEPWRRSTSVEIDGHVLLDMDDFASLVDAVDGVEVSPEEPLVDPIVDLDLEAGPQTLDAAADARLRAHARRPGLRPDGPPAGSRRGSRPAPRRSRDRARPLRAARRPRLARDRSSARRAVRRCWSSRAARATPRSTSWSSSRPLITFAGDRGDGRGYILEMDVEAIRAEVQELIGD